LSISTIFIILILSAESTFQLEDSGTACMLSNLRFLPSMNTLLLILDLTGTFVFAIGGAVIAVRHRLDFFGVLVVSFVAANSGGIMRDVLLGAVPPAAIDDWRYIAVSLPAGAVVFLWSSATQTLRVPLLVLDAAGLSLFAVAGTLKSLDLHLNPVAAILLGVLTGVGGGMVRDVLVREIPVVLRTDFYAVAALFGAIVVAIGHAWGWPSLPIAIAGGAVCFILRLLAIWRGWRLPNARPSSELTR
jgi:uncharacterized membrane protein YeiH